MSTQLSTRNFHAEHFQRSAGAYGIDSWLDGPNCIAPVSELNREQARFEIMALNRYTIRSMYANRTDKWHQNWIVRREIEYDQREKHNGRERNKKEDKIYAVVNNERNKDEREETI